MKRYDLLTKTHSKWKKRLRKQPKIGGVRDVIN